MKSKSNIASIFITVILLMLNSCVYTDIYTFADSGADFNRYHTFAWLPDETDTNKLPFNNEIIRDNIRNYFGQSFSERGYTVNLDTPDILLKLVIVNERKEELWVNSYPWPYYFCRYYYGSAFYFPYEFNYYYRNHLHYCYPSNYFTTTNKYFESSITLNVIDTKQNKLVWTGTAKGDIYDKDFVNKNIHPAVKKIMKRYPVKPVHTKR